MTIFVRSDLVKLNKFFETQENIANSKKKINEYHMEKGGRKFGHKYPLPIGDSWLYIIANN